MSPDPFDKCRFLLDRWKGFALWRNLWTILLFVFGAFVVGFLCWAIASYRGGDSLSLAGGAIATLASGAGIAWVYSRRMEAMSEEKTAYDELINRCGKDEPTAAIEGAKAREVAKQGLDLRAEVEAYQRRLRLLGPIR